MNTEIIVNKLNEFIGKDIVRSGDEHTPVESISTGIEALDIAIGSGGFPKGKIVDIYGHPGSSKTSLCLAIMAHHQKNGLRCAFIDAEYSLSPKLAESYGVDMSKLVVVQPDCCEEALTAIEYMLREKLADFIVLDSETALMPKPVIEAEMGTPPMAAKGRIMSQGLGKIIAPLANSGATLVIISQLRKVIVSYGGNHNPFAPTAGEAQRFYSHLTIEVVRKNALSTPSGTVQGYEIELRIKKNKVGPPGGSCIIQLLIGQGFKSETDVFTKAEEAGIIKKNGMTYFFGEVKMAVGKQKTLEFLSEHADVAAQIKEKLLSV